MAYRVHQSAPKLAEIIADYEVPSGTKVYLIELGTKSMGKHWIIPADVISHDQLRSEMVVQLRKDCDIASRLLQGPNDFEIGEPIFGGPRNPGVETRKVPAGTQIQLDSEDLSQNLQFWKNDGNWQKSKDPMARWLGAWEGNQRSEPWLRSKKRKRKGHRSIAIDGYALYQFYVQQVKPAIDAATLSCAPEVVPSGSYSGGIMMRFVGSHDAREFIKNLPSEVWYSEGG